MAKHAWLAWLSLRPRRHVAVWVLLGFLVGYGINSGTSWPDKALDVTFVNSTDQRIHSIQLDFGHAQGQSSLMTLQLAPEESRRLLLNHEPGAGFNVKVSYADGLVQDFCANQGVKGRRQQVVLSR